MFLESHWVLKLRKLFFPCHRVWSWSFNVNCFVCRLLCPGSRVLLNMLFNLNRTCGHFHSFRDWVIFTGFSFFICNISWLNNITRDHNWKTKVGPLSWFTCLLQNLSISSLCNTLFKQLLQICTFSDPLYIYSKLLSNSA